jgi:hypothetical protein
MMEKVRKCRKMLENDRPCQKMQMKCSKISGNDRKYNVIEKIK